MRSLHNPYTLSFSQKRMHRLLAKLNHLINLIEQDYYLDRERFQLLLEMHWLHSRAESGSLPLPTWELYLFSALRCASLASDNQINNAVLAIINELSN